MVPFSFSRNSARVRTARGGRWGSPREGHQSHRRRHYCRRFLPYKQRSCTESQQAAPPRAARLSLPFPADGFDLQGSWCGLRGDGRLGQKRRVGVAEKWAQLSQMVSILSASAPAWRRGPLFVAIWSVAIVCTLNPAPCAAPQTAVGLPALDSFVGRYNGPMDPDSPPQTRLCRQCGEEYPLDHFRRKGRDGARRETACRACHKANMRAWRRSRSERALKRFVKRAPNQNLDRRLRALADATLRRFGGVESLSKVLVNTAKDIHEARPCDPLPLQSAMTVLRLHEYVASRRQAVETPEEDGYSGLTIDETRARIRQSIIDLIRKEPAIAVAAATSLGWIVISASGPESAIVD